MTGGDLDGVLRLKRVGDLDGALVALEGVLAHKGAIPAGLAQMADIQLRRGRLSEAEQALERAEAQAGTTAFTARVRGDLCYRRKRFAEAARAYQEAEALGDRATWTLVQLGRSRMRTGDVEGARGAAAAAIERDEKASAAWVLLGEIESGRGCLEEAEAMYARAHENDPRDQWAHAKLIEARLLRLPPERRQRELEVLLKSNGPANRHLAAVLARLRSQGGDDLAAAEVWRERAARHGDGYARKMHGFALRRAGALEEAAAVLGRCLLDDPHDVAVWRTYLNLQRSRGATEELRHTLEELLPRAGDREGAVLGALRKLGPRREAKDDSGEEDGPSR